MRCWEAASGITEQKRAIWQLDRFQVFDGGADGAATTENDNDPFLDSGLASFRSSVAWIPS